MVSVGPQRGYDQENGHACKQEGARPVIIGFIFKKEKHHHRSHIEKPQNIWNNKSFQEGDVIIHRHVDHVIAPGNGFLKMSKPGYIDYAI